MKKLILATILVLFSASVAEATWTFRFHQPFRMSKNYLKWAVTLTSDGSAMTATDLLATAGLDNRLKALIQGSSFMLMKVSPGTPAPDTTIDIQLEDEENDDLWAKTTISYTAISWHKLWEDIGSYPPAITKLYLVVNDIGDDGDQVTLYFICWIENP